MNNDLPETTSVVYVDKQLADSWLTRNKKNRALNRKRVEHFAGAMTRGEWKFTGEAIKFSKEGLLLDGQTRLAATSLADARVPMLVVVGLDEDAQAVMDTGQRRTAAQALGLLGKKNASTLAAMIQFDRQVERNRFDYGIVMTHPEIIEVVERAPELEDIARRAHTYSARTGLKSSVIGVALWRLSRIDADAATAFFDSLADMKSEGPGDPIYTLLDRVRKAHLQQEKVSQKTELGWIYRAWNARREGRPLQQIKLRPDWDLPAPK